MNSRSRRRRCRSRKKALIVVLCLLVIVACATALFFLLRNKTGDNSKEIFDLSAEAETETNPESFEYPEDDAEADDSSGDSFETAEERSTEEEDPGFEAARIILDSMSLDEKIYQLFIITPEQLTGSSSVTESDETCRISLEKYPVGGIIYSAPNIISRDQCISMISDIQSYSKYGLIISVDEEGGSVARLEGNAAMEMTVFPDMGVIGATGDVSQAYDVGYTIGTEISELGFNLDFAPVADVNTSASNTVIGSRAFSSDPDIAAGMVAACVNGFNDSGILCTLKHFPGHGDTISDSHYGRAETYKTLEELYECEFLPFEAGIDADAPLVMIGHISTPNITDEDVPASLSYEIITDILRNSLGFTGVVITDAMNMQAITDLYSSKDASVMAIQSGVDIILMPQDLEEAVQGIKDALLSGELMEDRIDESVLRILEVKIRYGIISNN